MNNSDRKTFKQTTRTTNEWDEGHGPVVKYISEYFACHLSACSLSYETFMHLRLCCQRPTWWFHTLTVCLITNELNKNFLSRKMNVSSGMYETAVWIVPVYSFCGDVSGAFGRAAVFRCCASVRGGNSTFTPLPSQSAHNPHTHNELSFSFRKIIFFSEK